MSILIKNLDMPKESILMTVDNGSAYVIPSVENEGKSYEVIEVKIPHGRLIDTDVVERDLQELSEDVENYFPLLNKNDALMFERGIQFARQYVLNLATTIIEAEEGEVALKQEVESNG